jgi:hypothetical protein
MTKKTAVLGGVTLLILSFTTACGNPNEELTGPRDDLASVWVTYQGDTVDKQFEFWHINNSSNLEFCFTSFTSAENNFEGILELDPASPIHYFIQSSGQPSKFDGQRLKLDLHSDLVTLTIRPEGDGDNHPLDLAVGGEYTRKE